MFSNYEDKGLRSAMIEGKRHFQAQKKTSLYGSETPREEKINNSRQRRGNPNNIFGSGEEEFLNKSSFMNDSQKFNTDQEKRATLEELQRYNPWGKPGAGAPNELNSNNSNRAKWEYEQEMKAHQKPNNNSDEGFPGFSGSFGTGQSSNNGRRRSDMSQNSDGKQINYSSFGNQGASIPGYESNANKNQDHDELTYKKYEETKAIADNLEKEIQQLKLKQLEERYAAMKNNQNQEYGYNDEVDDDHKSNSNYVDDPLYREAENRARLRELDRLKESYDRGYPEHESNHNHDLDNRDRVEMNGNGLMNDNFIPNDHKRQMDVKKNSVTNNRNDYRPYTVEECLNCRPQMINPSLHKRTTLSGSEERRANFNPNDSGYNFNNNANMQMIDEENIIRKFSKSNTHSNLFPSDKVYSPSSTPYQTKAPYATD